MDNIYHYIGKLPDGINEIVMPCYDGYNIYTDSRLTLKGRIEAYNHALAHIENNDWEEYYVQKIESSRH